MNGKEKINSKYSKISKAAEKVFAEKGFAEGTIPDIAREAGISEASIYDYFSTKENLIFSIPLEPIRKLHETAVFHLSLIKGPSIKLYAIFKLQLLFYKENPEFASVLMLILKQNKKFIGTEAHESIREYLAIFDQIIEEGISIGEFRSDVDPYYLRSSMLGAMEHVLTNWLMVGHPKDLMDAVDPLYNLGIKMARSEEKQICVYPIAINLTKEINDIASLKTGSAS